MSMRETFCYMVLPILLLGFVSGYGLRMYQHPNHYQTEQERYDAGWYKEYLERYLPPEYKREEEPKKPRTHIPVNPELIQKVSG